MPSTRSRADSTPESQNLMVAADRRVGCGRFNFQGLYHPTWFCCITDKNVALARDKEIMPLLCKIFDDSTDLPFSGSAVTVSMRRIITPR
jgi:hypothetical protein